MAQSILVKKNGSIVKVVESLPADFSEDQFVDAFIEKFPREWEKIQKVYNGHDKGTKPGESNPMPVPRKYLLNALKAFNKKNKK